MSSPSYTNYELRHLPRTELASRLVFACDMHAACLRTLRKTEDKMRRARWTIERQKQTIKRLKAGPRVGRKFDFSSG